MKKIYMPLILILVISGIMMSPASVFAVTTTTATNEKETMVATSEADQTVVTSQTTTTADYTLPYPGMLPDNPLYFLKQVRDWILDKLIVDPVKKAEFYILQGDKRVAMGVLLGAGGKALLGEQVISKGEKYMNNAVQSLLAMKSQGKNVPAYIVDRLEKALTKHAEVLTAEITKAQGAEKSGLMASLTLVQNLLTELEKLK